MKAILIASALGLSFMGPVAAKPPTVSCITERSHEKFDVVALGSGRVLFSMNNGDFYDGQAATKDNMLAFMIQDGTAGIAIAINLDTEQGRIAVTVDGKEDLQNITCKFH